MSEAAATVPAPTMRQIDALLRWLKRLRAAQPGRRTVGDMHAVTLWYLLRGVPASPLNHLAGATGTTSTTVARRLLDLQQWGVLGDDHSLLISPEV